MIREQLLAMPRSSFLTILALLMLVVLAALSVYGLVPKYKIWMKSNNSYEVLNNAAGSAINLNDQINNMDSELKALQQKLNGDSASLPFKQFESHVIGQLQEVAWQHNVQLAAITPRRGDRVDMFREMLFEVDISGDYFDIHRLLKEFRNKLGFVVVKKIDLEPGNDAEKKWLDVSLTLASYRVEKV